MSTFLQLHNFTDGEIIYINLENINYFVSDDGGTNMYDGTEEGGCFRVLEPPIEIMRLLEEYQTKAEIRESLRLIELFHHHLPELK